MNDVVAEYRPSTHVNAAGIVVDIAENSLDRVSKVLSGIPGGVQKAVGSALARAGRAGKTEVKKAIAQEYTISSGQFLRYTRNINHLQGGSSGLSVVFGYAGSVIPLMQFSTSVSRSSGVSAQVKRGGSREAIEHAFKAQMGGHTGIYERIGVDRFPVKEFFGPSTPQMMYSNEDVLDAVEEKMAETYDKRIDHEIMRILNGWGG